MADLEHFGIKGMHWGHHKAPTAASPMSLRDQAVQGVRHDAGKLAVHQVLKNYGHLALPAAKGAVKGTATVLRYSGHVARGAGTAIKVLAVVGKYSFRFGKAYGRGAIKLAKLGR